MNHSPIPTRHDRIIVSVCGKLETTKDPRQYDPIPRQAMASVCGGHYKIIGSVVLWKKRIFAPMFWLSSLQLLKNHTYYKNLVFHPIKSQNDGDNNNSELQSTPFITLKLGSIDVSALLKKRLIKVMFYNKKLEWDPSYQLPYIRLRFILGSLIKGVHCITDSLEFHFYFCRDITPRIGDLIMKFAPFLKLYTEYVKNFDNSRNVIMNWTNKSPRFNNLLAELQVKTYLW